MDWSQTVYVALTGGFALAGALGGAALSDKRALRREQVAREDAARDELRGVLTELLVDARDLIDNEWLMIPFFANSAFEDLQEFIETDSGKEMGARHKRLRRSLTASRLLASVDGELGIAILRVGVLFDQIPREAHGPVLGKKKTPQEKQDGMTPALKHVNKLQKAVDETELAAMRELARLGSQQQASIGNPLMSRACRWVKARLQRRP